MIVKVLQYQKSIIFYSITPNELLKILLKSKIVFLKHSFKRQNIKSSKVIQNSISTSIGLIQEFLIFVLAVILFSGIQSY